MNPVPVWNNMTIFAVIIVIVGFSMFMGQKSPKHGSRSGWWAGLVVLLIVLSALFGTTLFRTRSVQEVRHAGRVTWSDQMKEEIKSRVREANEQAAEAVEEAKRAMNNALKHGDQSRPRNRVEIHELPDPPVPPIMTSTRPLKDFTFEVSLPKGERTQKLDDLEKKLKAKAADRVTAWVRETIPYRVYTGRFLTPQFLEANGAFPHPVEPEGEPIPRTGSNGNDKDYLYNGVLKVVLSTSLQEQLIKEGFRVVGEQLQEEKLLQQSVILFILLGSTIAAGGIGTLCYLHRLWQSRNTELALSRAA
jgi:hypothetical protein